MCFSQFARNLGLELVTSTATPRDNFAVKITVQNCSFAKNDSTHMEYVLERNVKDLKHDLKSIDTTEVLCNRL